MATTITALRAGLAFGLAASNAAAQTPRQVSWEADGAPPVPGTLAAPANAFELSVGMGYTQGFGMIRPGLSVPDVVTPGIGFDLGLGYRLDPHWGLLVSAQYHELTAERAAAAHGVTISLAAQYHLAPMRRIDPWFEFGAGYRFLWEDRPIGPNSLIYGFQLARVRLGIDARADENVALGPVIGADLNLFMLEDVPNVSTAILQPLLNTFVFAGVQGRFDVGGRRETTLRPSFARR